VLPSAISIVSDILDLGGSRNGETVRAYKSPTPGSTAMHRTPTNSRFARGGRRGRSRERRRGSLGKRLLAIYIVASLLSIALTGGALRFML
jgi:hypothetical protein